VKGGDTRRASYLGPYEMFRLDQACKPIAEAFDELPYLVGSVMERPEYRDVDVRLILDDEQYAQLASAASVALLNIALTAYLRQSTGLPVDFGIQQQSAANARHTGYRNPLGLRSLDQFPGDGAPVTGRVSPGKEAA
jgi:hypothetical protein